MGTEKDREIEKEDSWNTIASMKGFVCSVCGEVLEKNTFRVNEQPYICSNCRNAVQKD